MALDAGTRLAFVAVATSRAAVLEALVPGGVHPHAVGAAHLRRRPRALATPGHALTAADAVALADERARLGRHVAAGGAAGLDGVAAAALLAGHAVAGAGAVHAEVRAGGHALPATVLVALLGDQRRAALGAWLTFAGAVGAHADERAGHRRFPGAHWRCRSPGRCWRRSAWCSGMQSPPQLPLEQRFGQTMPFTQAPFSSQVWVVRLFGPLQRFAAGLAHAGALAHAAADVRAGHGVRDPLALGVAGLGRLVGPAVLAVRACTCRRRRPPCRRPRRSPSSPRRRRPCRPRRPCPHSGWRRRYRQRPLPTQGRRQCRRPNRPPAHRPKWSRLHRLWFPVNRRHLRRPLRHPFLRGHQTRPARQREPGRTGRTCSAPRNRKPPHHRERHQKRTALTFLDHPSRRRSYRGTAGFRTLSLSGCFRLETSSYVHPALWGSFGSTAAHVDNPGMSVRSFWRWREQNRVAAPAASTPPDTYPITATVFARFIWSYSPAQSSPPRLSFWTPQSFRRPMVAPIHPRSAVGPVAWSAMSARGSAIGGDAGPPATRARRTSTLLRRLCHRERVDRRLVAVGAHFQADRPVAHEHQFGQRQHAHSLSVHDHLGPCRLAHDPLDVSYPASRRTAWVLDRPVSRSRQGTLEAK